MNETAGVASALGVDGAQMATIFALSRLAESRDSDTGRHLERIQALCRLLASHLAAKPEFRDRIDASFVEDIFRASPLHDIGKVGIPDRVLLKPGRLTLDEAAITQRHTIIGAETLEAVRAAYPNNAFVAMGVSIARSHHERWDGSGYPDGLAGDAIPLAARIMAVADAYDALRSRRCYKEAYPHGKARELILASGGTQFDPAVVAAFDELEGDFEKVRSDLGETGVYAAMRRPETHA
jgi:putative two-component system response regulator